jgi:hypothetical protein
VANPKTFKSDFQRGIEAALELCREVRDEKPVPKTWSKEFAEGHRSGAECCCSMIINKLHPKL